MVNCTLIRRFTFSLKQSSGKSGWGPYRNLRKGDHFVGTEPHPLKYHVYGLQGTHHMLPGTGKVSSTLPTRTILKKIKFMLGVRAVIVELRYYFVFMLPLCDGSHLHYYIPTNLKPVRFIPDKDMEVWFCNCKQTKTRPFCDGSHREIRAKLKKFLKKTKISNSAGMPRFI
ncbi:CDGSH iron-sulfur domain-containing protein 3, mitochondrial [Dirofilaria immitis]|nr:CDGSH iron-sulfur domain-containing protein 3, mitochondrial [Dirofilaria immitis]